MYGLLHKKGSVADLLLFTSKSALFKYRDYGILESKKLVSGSVLDESAKVHIDFLPDYIMLETKTGTINAFTALKGICLQFDKSNPDKGLFTANKEVHTTTVFYYPSGYDGQYYFKMFGMENLTVSNSA